MRNVRFYLIIITMLVVAIGAMAHFKAMREINARTARLEAQLAAISGQNPDEPEIASAGSRESLQETPATRSLARRLAEIERTLVDIVHATDYLMERGQLPLATNKMDELHARFMDPAAPDGERLRALRLLRRNQAVNDQTVYNALAWLESSTNSRTRRDLLQQLDGVTNAALKQPLLNLAMNESSADVREEAVENLRRFLDDPAVENSLWERLRSETDGDVRDEIEDTLEEGPATPARIASLQQRAADPQSSLDERLMALRALDEADGDVSGVIADLARVAQTSQDPAERAQLFRAFDGLEDPNLKLPLVQGLQDPNPLVRERAADALSAFRTDSTVQQWLRHIAENDADPRVQREAFDSLQTRGR